MLAAIAPEPHIVLDLNTIFISVTGFLLVWMSSIITSRATKAFDDLHGRVDLLTKHTDDSFTGVKEDVAGIKIRLEGLHSEHNVFKTKGILPCIL